MGSAIEVVPSSHRFGDVLMMPKVAVRNDRGFFSTSEALEAKPEDGGLASPSGESLTATFEGLKFGIVSEIDGFTETTITGSSAGSLSGSKLIGAGEVALNSSAAVGAAVIDDGNVAAVGLTSADVLSPLLRLRILLAATTPLIAIHMLGWRTCA